MRTPMPRGLCLPAVVLAAGVLAGCGLVVGDTIYMVSVTNRCDSTFFVVDAGWAASDYPDHWDDLDMGAVTIEPGETLPVGVMSPEPGHYLAVGDLTGVWRTGPEVTSDAASEGAAFAVEGAMCP